MNNQLFDLIFKINDCVEKENKKDLYRKQLRIAGFSEGFGEDTFLQTFENLDFLCLDESQAKKIKVEVYVDLKKEETTYTVYGFGGEINFVCKIGENFFKEKPEKINFLMGIKINLDTICKFFSLDNIEKVKKHL